MHGGKRMPHALWGAITGASYERIPAGCRDASPRSPRQGAGGGSCGAPGAATSFQPCLAPRAPPKPSYPQSPTATAPKLGFPATQRQLHVLP